MSTGEVDDHCAPGVVPAEQLVLDLGVLLAVLGEVDGEVVALHGAVAEGAVFVVLVSVSALKTINLVT